MLLVLNDTVLLSTQNLCYNWWVKEYLQFYAPKRCLSQPVIQLLEALQILMFGIIMV